MITKIAPAITSQHPTGNLAPSPAPITSKEKRRRYKPYIDEADN